MALADLFLAVTNQCTAALLAAGQAAMVPAYAFGHAQKRQRTVPPRISWHWAPETFGPPSMQGPVGNKSGNPRALRSRIVNVKIEVWGPMQTFSPMMQNGSQQGAIALSGTPVTMYGLQFRIVAAGLAGVATFQYSLDSGQTWSSTFTTGAAVAVDSTGVLATFTGSFQVGDAFWCVAHDQLLADYASTEYLLNVFLAATHAQLRGSYELLSGEWMNQEQEEVAQGKTYNLDMRILTPVLEMPVPAIALTTVRSVQQTDIIGNTSTTP